MRGQGQPWQLEIADKQRRAYPRPAFEDLPALDCRMLARRRLFPANWFDRHEYENFAFIVPAIRTLTLSRAQAEILLASSEKSQKPQTFRIHWQKIGGKCRGSVRPSFVCTCGKGRHKLYLLYGQFRCCRCAIGAGAIYLSQMIGQKARSALQAKRMRRFLGNYDESSPIRQPAFMQYRVTFNRFLRAIARYEAKGRHMRPGKASKVLADERSCKPMHRYGYRSQATA
jgi:hypothetical protein